MNAKYKPLDSSVYPRFSGIKTFMRLPCEQTLEDIDFAVVGIPFDTGTSFRSGTRYGPESIRNSSSLVRTYSYQHGINLFDYVSGVDFGDIPITPGYIHETYESIEKNLYPIVEKGIIPIVMGGDHSITLAELRAVSRKYGPVALIQFDSHSDIADLHMGQKYTHGTPFRRAVEEKLVDPLHSIQIGMRGSLNDPKDIDGARELGYKVVTTDELFDMGINELVTTIKKRVGNKPTFLTFDIDFIDPSFAPGTGTPEVGGILSREAIQILRGLTNINFVGYDMVEVLPSFDQGNITSLLAANLMFEMIALIALNKKKK